MLRSVFSQIGARMDAAGATRPSLAVAQAILAKTRKGLVEQGESAALFHAEGFGTLLAWIGAGLKRTPEETTTLKSATWQELVWVRRRLKDDQASLKILDGSPSSIAREVASQLAFACGHRQQSGLAPHDRDEGTRGVPRVGRQTCRRLRSVLAADDVGCGRHLFGLRSRSCCSRRTAGGRRTRREAAGQTLRV